MACLPYSACLHLFRKKCPWQVGEVFGESTIKNLEREDRETNFMNEIFMICIFSVTEWIIKQTTIKGVIAQNSVIECELGLFLISRS